MKKEKYTFLKPSKYCFSVICMFLLSIIYLDARDVTLDYITKSCEGYISQLEKDSVFGGQAECLCTVCGGSEGSQSCDEGNPNVVTGQECTGCEGTGGSSVTTCDGQPASRGTTSSCTHSADVNPDGSGSPYACDTANDCTCERIAANDCKWECTSGQDCGQYTYCTQENMAANSDCTEPEPKD